MPPEGEQSVLGIDAAWTDHEPSGVALITRTGGRWRSLRVAPSYSSFCSMHGSLENAATGTPIDVDALLHTCGMLLVGALVNAVAVDMPLGRTRIVGRRVADQAVSKRFGHCGAAVHSPTNARPGATGERLQGALFSAGCELATSERLPERALLEVYPHVALLGLMNAPRRLPYKVSRNGKYWAGTPIGERKARLVREWRAILDRLSGEIDGIDIAVPDRPEHNSFRELKSIEDKIDALVCAWVGAQFLDGAAVPLGDAASAIWVPCTAMKFAKATNGT